MNAHERAPLNDVVQKANRDLNQKRDEIERYETNLLQKSIFYNVIVAFILCSIALYRVGQVKQGLTIICPLEPENPHLLIEVSCSPIGHSVSIVNHSLEYNLTKWHD